jgi:hypothetical protein
VDGPRFSVRRWVEGEGCPGSFLFVSARYVDMAVASRLLTVWMDTAMNTLMAGPRSPDLKLWFLFDELGALHRLPALEKGLQTARNYGGAIVAGVHAYAKLKETYGDNMAMTLAALARTKLVLATADRESATWCSDFIGHRQYREMEEGYSYGYNNARDAVSLTPRRQIEPLLLPDQLMNLPRLQGYLKFPDGFPAAPIRLDYVGFTGIAAPFEPRPPLAPRPAIAPSSARASDAAGEAPPGANDQGPGPRNAREEDASAGRDLRGTDADQPGPRAADPADRHFNPALIRSTGAGSEVSSSPDGQSLDEPSTAARPAMAKPPGSGGETVEPSKEPGEGSRAERAGRSGRFDPGRSVRPLPSPENITRRELREGIAPPEDRSTDQPDLGF